MIPVIEKRIIPFVFSGLLFAGSVVVLFLYGLKPGIDFTGGSLLEVRFTEGRPATAVIQDALRPLTLEGAQIQSSDENGVIIRTRFLSEEEHQTILGALRTIPQEGVDTTSTPSILEERFETIGPTVSSHLRQRSFTAAVIVIAAMVGYIAYAFRKVSKPVQSWKYGLTAIIALIHDVTITMGVFALLGRFRGVEVDIPFVVALLTIMGYSVNDTIIVFDRIRENLIKRGSDNFAETVNLGLNQTFTRSLNTSFTTLLVLVALFFFGGASIHYFSLALIIGIAVGTYSSIFLASPLLVVWERWKR